MLLDFNIKYCFPLSSVILFMINDIEKQNSTYNRWIPRYPSDIYYTHTHDDAFEKILNQANKTSFIYGSFSSVLWLVWLKIFITLLSFELQRCVTPLWKALAIPYVPIYVSVWPLKSKLKGPKITFMTKIINNFEVLFTKNVHRRFGWKQFHLFRCVVGPNERVNSDLVL